MAAKSKKKPNRPGRGRPTVGSTHAAGVTASGTFRLGDAVVGMIGEIAEARGVTRSEVVRTAVASLHAAFRAGRGGVK